MNLDCAVQSYVTVLCNSPAEKDHTTRDLLRIGFGVFHTSRDIRKGHQMTRLCGWEPYNALHSIDTSIVGSRKIFDLATRRAIDRFDTNTMEKTKTKSLQRPPASPFYSLPTHSKRP
ncbi:unnamed protein product [Somion occarium]|uniref:Uncharacterized protein n=1 Tax=Somion occarium TaxID=3059160 RepID=A0ABP1E681_9APHY